MKVSPSRLNTFLKCPQQYVLEYLQEERPPRVPFLPADFGTFVHEVIELVIKSPDENPIDILSKKYVKVFGEDVYNSVQEYADTYHSAVRDTLQHGETIGKSYRSPSMTNYFKFKHGDKLVNRYRAVLGHEAVDAYPFWDDAHRCLEYFLKWHSKYDGKLSMSEQKLEGVVLGYVGKEPVYFNGVIDFIHAGDDELLIVDFKTNSKPYDDAYISFSTQLGMYAVAGESFFGKLPRVGYLELRQCKFTVKDVDEEELKRYKEFFNVVFKSMRKFEKAYAKHKAKGGSDDKFLITYSDRFPVGSATTQGCPCNFLSSCIFKDKS